MSVHEYAEAPEPRSSVKLSRNASGNTQIELKVVAGEEPGLIEAAKAKAVLLYNELCGVYPQQQAAKAGAR